MPLFGGTIRESRGVQHSQSARRTRQANPQGFPTKEGGRVQTWRCVGVSDPKPTSYSGPCRAHPEADYHGSHRNAHEGAVSLMRTSFHRRHFGQEGRAAERLALKVARPTRWRSKEPATDASPARYTHGHWIGSSPVSYDCCRWPLPLQSLLHEDQPRARDTPFRSLPPRTSHSSSQRGRHLYIL